MDRLIRVARRGEPMVRSNQLPRSVCLCLVVVWGGMLFTAPPPGAASPRLKPQLPAPQMLSFRPSFFASPFEPVRPNASAVSPDRFLSLPFPIHPEMHVVQGWIYIWGYAHLGIDFVAGDVNYPDSWQSFDVVAAADGEACANCVEGPGNKVWIKHTVDNRVYYTYYGHLATIDPAILSASGAAMVRVTRGQKIGTAGNSGTWYIHLHFGVYTPAWFPIDPYDLYTDRSAYYPNPDYQKMGASHLFLDDPPPDPAQVPLDRAVVPHHSRRRSR